jgi:short-subunit dehydrogenase
LFGLVALPTQSAYNASKFAVKAFTESLKMEFAGSPIGVSCVHPGGIKTSIGKHTRVREDSISVSKEQFIANFEKMATTTAERAAAVIIRGVERKRRRILNGFDARLFDWISRLLPGSYEKIFGLERVARARNEARRASKP